jgi:hypothetical protein
MDEARTTKVSKYLEELTALNKRYQLHMVPFIEYTHMGTFPRFTVEDLLPEPEPPKPTPPPLLTTQEATPTA